jgi:hypothetical protein
VEITMPLNRKIPAEELTPARLWAELDDDTRRLAARSLYRGEWEDPMGRREADLAIAEALRFREVAVRPDDSLARSLLLALHLGQRKPILESFLDALEIPHEGGMIDENFDLEPPDAARLTGAVEKLRAGFPDDEVEIYLASLLAMDPETWAGLAELDRGSVGQ